MAIFIQYSLTHQMHIVYNKPSNENGSQLYNSSPINSYTYECLMIMNIITFNNNF